jgi:hypothetical protein
LSDHLAPHSAKIYGISGAFDSKWRITSVARKVGNVYLARVKVLETTLIAQHTDPCS